MLFPRFLNSANISLNGIPENYDPAIPADSVVQSLTPFEIVKKASLKALYQPAFKGVLNIGPTATTVNLKVNGAAFGTALASTNATVAGSDVTSTAANGNIHFGDSGKVLKTGDVIDVSNFPAVGVITLYLFEKQDTTNILNSYGLLISITTQNTLNVSKYTGTGAATALVTNSPIDNIGAGEKLSVEITATSVIIKRQSVVLYTHNLQYKARLLNEAGNTVDANAGTLTLADGSAYGNGLVAANTELKYVVGEVLGAYNVEIESELGRKILQKVIVVDTASGSGSLSNILPLSLQNTNTNNDSPASWWNRYKTVFLVGGIVLGISLLGAYLINKLSK